MIRTAQGLIDAYSGLGKTEQQRFDRKYKELIRFRKWLSGEATRVTKPKRKGHG